MGIRRTKQGTVNVVLAILVLAALAGAIVGLGRGGGLTFQPQALPGDVTNFSGVHIAAPTAGATATPALLANQAGLGAIAEFQDGGSAVWSVANGGNVSATGGQNYSNWLKVAGPTAIATATPAMVVDSLGVSVILDVRDAATPVWSIANGGAVTQVGARTATGGDTVNNWAKVAAPTAIATATPAMVVDSLGVSNILEVRDAATPVFTIRNGGTVIGNVLQYGSSGYKIVCNTTTITGTGALAHGLATPVAVVGALSEDVTGDHAHVSFTNSAATVTAKVWDTALTPAASSAGATVDWCVVGVP